MPSPAPYMGMVCLHVKMRTPDLFFEVDLPKDDLLGESLGQVK